MMEKRKLSLLLINLFLPFAAHALSPSHFVVTPSCLVKNLDANFEILSTQGEFVLIKTDDTGIDKLSEAKGEKQCGNFMDVTLDWQDFKSSEGNKAKSFLKDHLSVKPKAFKSASALAYSIRFPTQVNATLRLLNETRIWNDLTAYSAFPDRYYRTDNGLKAAQWIQGKVREIAGSNPNVTMYTVPTATYKQPSVVVKLAGLTTPDTAELPGIVIGAHMDTLSGFMPGADDDGTGTVTVLETFRDILNSGYKFKKPIYFIWYAAEEVGLVGSQYVVRDFQSKNIPISEVMQLDMTGYPSRNYPTSMWLMTDNVSLPLTNYIQQLISTYVKKPVRRDYCGYGCSDHARWYQQGYATVMPFEASLHPRTYNPNIHKSTDTMEKLVRAHMKSFAMLAIAFAVELAEPVSA
jgi:leucyl aminopeptidase